MKEELISASKNPMIRKTPWRSGGFFGVRPHQRSETSIFHDAAKEIHKSFS
jgi:hypothetical protein